MTRVVLTGLLFTLQFQLLLAQVDSAEARILRQSEYSKSEIISKGRRLLLDRLISGDITAVKKVKVDLETLEDDDYVTLHPIEKWLLPFWTGEYDALLIEIQKGWPRVTYGYFSREDESVQVYPVIDALSGKLMEKSFEERDSLTLAVTNSHRSEEEKEIIKLTFDWLIRNARNSPFSQDSLNDDVDDFLEMHANSSYGDFATSTLRYKYKRGAFGGSYELFSGYGVHTAALAKRYTNSFVVGMGVDMTFYRAELSFRGSVGWNKTKTSMTYSLGTYEKGSGSDIFLFAALLGGAVFDNDRFKVSPFAGIGSMDIGPSDSDVEEIPELDEVSLEYTTTLLTGISFDLKFGPKSSSEYMPKSEWGFMRVRYEYAWPRFDQKYPGINGGIHYVTIGFGGMRRMLKRG